MADPPAPPPADAGKLADLHALLEVSCQLGAGSELGPILHTIEQASLRVLGCERTTIFLYDRHNDELYSRVATGQEGIRFPAGRGIAGEAFHGRAVINVPDAYADPRFNPEVDRRTGYKTRNMLTLPMVSPQGRVVGVFQLLNKRGGPFTGEDVEVLSLLATSASVAVDNANRARTAP